MGQKETLKIYIKKSINKIKSIMKNYNNIELYRETITEDLYNEIFFTIRDKSINDNYIKFLAIMNYGLNIKYINMDKSIEEIKETIKDIVDLYKDGNIRRYYKSQIERKAINFYKAINIKKNTILLVNKDGQYEIRKSIKVFNNIDNYKDIISIYNDREKTIIKKFYIWNLIGEDLYREDIKKLSIRKNDKEFIYKILNL